MVAGMGERQSITRCAQKEIAALLDPWVSIVQKPPTMNVQLKQHHLFVFEN